METQVKIENLQQLRAQIKTLRLQQAEQELYFLEKKQSFQEAIKSPFKFLKKVGSFLGFNSKEKQGVSPKNADWVTSLARIFVPFVLNKTLLRGNGLFLKSVLTLISQRAINPQNVNQHTLSSLIDKVSSWINSTLKSKKKKDIDYGIPPDSETF